jgi:alanine dehydrogenase
MLIFDNRRVLKSLDLRSLIEAVERMYAELASGVAKQPPRQAVHVPGTAAMVLPMCALSAASEIACVKLLVDNPANLAEGRSQQRSAILAVSAQTGECIGVFEGGAITQLRTAAASAVATRVLARPDVRVLGLIGAGALARSHLRAIAVVRDIAQVVVWSRTRARIEQLSHEAARYGIACTIAPSPKYVVQHSDIICTLTPSREPVVHGSWLCPGQHLNAVGAPPRPDYREIDGETLRRARVVVDSRAVAFAESGAILAAIREGAITADDINLELGQVLARGSFRRDDEDITVYNSVGLPIQDLAAVTELLRRAEGTDASLDRATECSDPSRDLPVVKAR